MTQPVPARGKPRLVVAFIAIALVVVAIDQVTKFYAVERLTPGVVVPVLGDLLGWQLIFNPGAAFSMATGMTWVLTVVAVVVVVVVLRVARRLRSRTWTLALGLLLGGAVGNLIDRLVREPGVGQGHVVDFINYNGWFVGNVADIAIVLAAVLIAVLALVGIEVDGRRAATRSATEPEDAAVDDSPLSEEPVVDEDEFTPHVVPVADDEDVDLARWVSDGEAAHERTSVPTDLTDEPSATPAAPAERPGEWTGKRPRWRSRRDMRTGQGPTDDG